MNKFTIIGTWRMSYGGALEAKSKKWNNITEFIDNAISHIEENDLFKSVGKGGLPNWQGKVQLDAGYMEGKSLNIGAIMGGEDILHPFKVAINLSKNKYNRFLSGDGVKKYALENNFKIEKIETEKAINTWKKRIKEVEKNHILNPYDGHDTVCFVGTDTKEDMIAGTSTSGLFLKKKGRVGDSPLVGSGFYADYKYGSASATGLGEDIARGLLSYKVVNNIKNGKAPHAAANEVLFTFIKEMELRGEKIGPISLISVNNKGEWGVATNCLFQFTVYSQDQDPTLYISQPNKKFNGTIFTKADDGYWEEYLDSLLQKNS